MDQEEQTSNTINHVEGPNQEIREPIQGPQSVKYTGANFYDNHIIRQMPLPTWDSDK